MQIKLFVAALFALFLAACNPMVQLDSSEQKIADWHELYNAGDARALYGRTAEEFRDVTSPQQMDDLVALVTERMGKVVSAERQGFNINSNNGVTSTVVTMKTEFELGVATETYTFQGSGEEMRLVGWNVDSENFSNPAPATVEPVEIELPERTISE